MTAPKNWIDVVFFGIREFLDSGVAQPERGQVNFADPFVVADNATDRRTEVSLPVASSSGTGLLPTTTGANKVLITDTLNAPVWSSFLALGTTPALTGDIRLISGAVIKARNNGNTADVPMFEYVGSSVLFNIGDNSANITTTQYKVGTGGSHLWQVGGTTQCTALTGAFQVNAGLIQVGASAFATAGTVRLRHGDDLQFRNSGNSGNIVGLAVSSDTVSIGDNGHDSQITGAFNIFLSAIRAELVNDTVIRFATANRTTPPSISQTIEAGSGVTADTMSLIAQDVSGGGNAVGGKLELRAGDATAGNGSGGHVLLRAGRKAGTGTDSNIALHADPASWNAGERIGFIGNATTVPTGNPASGGYIYSEAGALKWRGSGGTITTMGPAEPHCQTCGRDCAVEWDNEAWTLAVCMWCLTEVMGNVGVIRKETR